MFYGDMKIKKRAFRVAKKIAMDSVPDKVEEIVRVLWRETAGNPKDGLRTHEMTKASRKLTLSTVFRGLQDLQMLGVVRQIGSGTKYRWSLSKKVAELILASGAFQEEQ